MVSRAVIEITYLRSKGYAGKLASVMLNILLDREPRPWYKGSMGRTLASRKATPGQASNLYASMVWHGLCFFLCAQGSAILRKVGQKGMRAAGKDLAESNKLANVRPMLPPSSKEKIYDGAVTCLAKAYLPCQTPGKPKKNYISKGAIVSRSADLWLEFCASVCWKGIKGPPKGQTFILARSRKPVKRSLPSSLSLIASQPKQVSSPSNKNMSRAARLGYKDISQEQKTSADLRIKFVPQVGMMEVSS